jgi:hypothetical protein
MMTPQMVRVSRQLNQSLSLLILAQNPYANLTNALLPREATPHMADRI